MMYNNIIFADKNTNIWRNTLPHIDKPFLEESLYGYLLRLDYINKFTPGTVMDMVKNHNTGRTSLNRPGLFLCGTIFNLNRLVEITCLQPENIHDLTLMNTLKRLFRTNDVYPQLIGYSNMFKICPVCIKEKKMQLIHSFNNIKTCISHKVFLANKCDCGNQIKLFSPYTDIYHCNACGKYLGNIETTKINNESEILKKELFLYDAFKNLIYKKTNLVNATEELSQGLENRLQFISYKKGIDHGKFKKLFGYNIDNVKNGHGFVNVSLSKLVDLLYALGYTPEAFRDILIDIKTKKTEPIRLPNNSAIKEHACPNVYCKYFNELEKSNVKYYGKKKNQYGKYEIEEYCTECGTRFFGNNIIQSYDYNPGLRQYDIEKARERITKWQENLKTTCREMIEKRIPITLTGCFKNAQIPIGKTYFVNRLGLIHILEYYAEMQKENMTFFYPEMDTNEIYNFIRRIYKKRNKNNKNV